MGLVGTYSGVLFGTAEIMLETKDEKILNELNLFVKNNLS
jgi:hypothetical protein